MTSHEYAERLRKISDFLLTRPSVEFGHGDKEVLYFYGKEEFVAAVKAMGSGKKYFSNDYFNFLCEAVPLELYANRSTVCRKVRDAEYECDPLFTNEEVEAL
jgi:hypothetical protein